MKRQFEFLNKDFEIVKEKCFLLSEINNIICTKKLKNFYPEKLSPSINFASANLDSSSKKQQFERKGSQNPELTTPLLNSLMKQKRKKEYREKTKLILQQSIKKT